MASSPFQRFRKHQKTFLALLCVLLMVAFVLADMFGNPGGPAGDNPVVVETSAGNLRRSTLASLQRSRSIANSFLYALTGSPEGFGPTDGESLLDLYLMSHKAEQLGMVVSNEVINDFLAELGPLTAEQIRRALDVAQVTETQLFAALRPELQARWLQNQFFYGVSAWTPAERWRLFQRLHRQINAEVLAVPVAAFTDKVPTPSDAELQRFFAQYQNRLADPLSPTPGFTQPQRANFQFVVADYNAMVEKARETITDEDIQNYYEQNKSLFPNAARNEEAPLEDPRELASPPAPRNTGAANDGEANGASANDGAALRDETVGRVYQVAYRADGAENQEQDEKPAADAPAADNQPAGNQPPLSAPAQNQPAEGAAPAAEAAPSAPSGPLPDRRTAQEIVRELVTIPQLHGGPAPEFEPLWRVKDEIRNRLAQERAEQWILDGRPGVAVGLRELHAQMSQYSNDWREADLRLEQGSKELDELRKQLEQKVLETLQPGVESSGYKVHSPTGMVTLPELRETELGQSMLVSTTPGVELPFNARDIAEPFRRSTLFEAGISRSTELDRNFYLFWKVNERQSYTPETMQEVREQVVAAWKLVNARKLAMDKAQELEAQARKENKPLTELSFDGNSGVELQPLTMMQPSFMQFGGSGLEWTPLPEEFKNPGSELQITLFGLQDGEYGVAYNAPQTIVYVMHVRDSSYVRSGQHITPFIAHQNFIATPLRNYANAAQPDLVELQQEWTSQLRKEYNVNIVGELPTR
jgi:hypothetical protein